KATRLLRGGFRVVPVLCPQPTSFPALEGPPPGLLPDAVLPLVAVLRQLAELIDRLGDEQYRTGPAGLVSGSVGGHVRHCPDHVGSLLRGLDTGLVDYDGRRRGTDVETCREAALAALRTQERHLLALPALPWQRPLRLSVLLSSSRPPVLAET